MHGHDVARPQARLHQAVQRIHTRPGLSFDVVVNITGRIVVGRMRRPSGEHHAHGFGNSAHSVGGKHRATRATPRHDALLKLGELIIANPASFMRRAALGVIHNGEVIALGGPGLKVDPARRARSRVDHQAKGIGSRQRHQRRRAALVTTGDDDHGLPVVCVMTGLNAIGHQVPRDETVARVARTLRHRIRNGRHPHQQPLPAPLVNGLDQQLRNALHPIVATVCIGVRAGNRHHRIAACRLARVEASRTQFYRAQHLTDIVPVALGLIRHDVQSSCEGDINGSRTSARRGLSPQPP